ncbi:MAG: glycosyltransferase family 2 protein [Crenarchaeota archaeon]|nr:glycosyltransferase family 2 protein [Thermoproteota archaeon]
MAIIIDNVALTSALLVLTLGDKIPLERADNSKISIIDIDHSQVSVIIPARYEMFETILQTVRSVLSQTYMPKRVFIVVEEDDYTTLENALKVRELFNNVEVIINRGRKSKGSGLYMFVYVFICVSSLHSFPPTSGLGLHLLREGSS